MRSASSLVVVGGFVWAFSAAVTHAEPVDCDAARCAIQSEIDAECPCGEAANHGRYQSCVARVVNRAAREARIPKQCRPRINGCFIRSLCGKRPRVVLCDLPGEGVSGRCRPLQSEGECTQRDGTIVTTCCAPCDAASPTPTSGEPSPTPTPVEPAATTTPTVATTTAVTPNATATIVADETATATPAVATPDATATIVDAETATPAPTPTPTTAAATASADVTATPEGSPTPTDAANTPSPGATATVSEPTVTVVITPVATTTPVPTATAPPLFLFVDIEGEPDQGAPPLTVAWTSDVSGGTPPYTYRWDFGDGSPHATGAHPVHVYEQVGDFTATLTVRDAGGLEESEELDVTVENE